MKISHPLVALTRVRLLEFVRDPSALFWVFGFPLLLALALGLAFRSKPAELTHVAVVEGAAPFSAAALRAAQTFDVRVLTLADAERALRKSAVDAIVVEGSGQDVSLRFDPSRPEGSAAQLSARDALERARGRKDLVGATLEPAVAPGTRYVDFLIPGLIGQNLMASSMWGTGFAIVDARKRKLLKRLAATPMRRSHYLGSFLIARFVFLLAEVTVLLVIGRYAFGVVNAGSVLDAFIVAVLGGAAFTGISLLVGTRTASIETASGWLNFVMLPMWVLSGSFFSAERFPDWTQPFIKVLPLTAVNDALRGIINDGESLFAMSAPLAIVAAWAVVTFALALRFFRWQ